jgi:hypothetical protein
MKWREASVLQTGREVQGFMDEHAELLGGYNNSEERGVLDAAVAALTAAATAQEFERTASKSLTVEKDKRRKELLDEHFLPIVAIARKLTKSKGTRTAAIQKIRMPPRRISDLRLASKARGMANGAAPYKAEFVAQQMPPDFAAQARRAAAALDSAVAARDQSVNNHVKATRDAAHQASIIRSAVRVLNGMVDSRLHMLKRFDLRKAWRVVRRFPRKPGVKRKRKAK